MIDNGAINIVVKQIEVFGRGAIILTGPSSCGKGAIADHLRTFLSIPKERHFSMGDILRRTIEKARNEDAFRTRLSNKYRISHVISIFDESENSTEDIEKASKYENDMREYYKNKEVFTQLDWLEFCVNKGLLVPDEWTVQIINAMFEDLTELKEEIFIIDGYPRTQVAAKALLDTFESLGLDIIKVIHLSITKDEMMKRALGRNRADDQVSSLERRYQFYQEHVQPSIDYMKLRLGNNRVELIDAHQPVFDEESKLLVERSIYMVVKDVMRALGLPKYLLNLK